MLECLQSLSRHHVECIPRWQLSAVIPAIPPKLNGQSSLRGFTIPHRTSLPGIAINIFQHFDAIDS